MTSLISRFRLTVLVAALAFAWRALTRSSLVRHPLFRPALVVGLVLAASHFAPEALLGLPLAVGVVTEGVRNGGFMVAEAPGTISRDNVTLTIPASTTLSAGTVLGRIGSSGKYVQFDDTLSDGGESAAGILYNTAVNTEAAPADITVAIVNYCAEVREADLIWAEGADSAAGLADLRTLGIKARPAQ